VKLIVNAGGVRGIVETHLGVIVAYAGTHLPAFVERVMVVENSPIV
jgi:hypothetical protein